MSETADGKFLRQVADDIEKSSRRPVNPETVARLRELADRCDIVTFPSLTLESRVWKMVEAALEREFARGGTIGADDALHYLIAIQLRKLGERTVLGGALAGLGTALASAAAKKTETDR